MRYGRILSAVVLGLAVSAFGATLTVGGTRPATVFVPSSYDPDIPIPLVFFLHGYVFYPGTFVRLAGRKHATEMLENF